MTKTSSKNPDPDQLLNTNSLTHKEIILRLDEIYNLLKDEKIEFDDKQLAKLEKIIEKSRYKELDEDYDRSQELPTHTEYPDEEKFLRSARFLSEKYLTKKEVESFIKKINEEISKISKQYNDPENYNITIRAPRASIRCSKNAQHLKKIIADNTSVIKSDSEEDLFILKYPDKISETAQQDTQDTMFNFSVKIVDNKFKIIFSVTFKEDNPEKMTPQDHLFPEEIQMAMFEKLMTLYPELETKLTTARKIDCIRQNITNPNSLVRISTYFECTSQNPETQSKMKSMIDSSPNQSNSQNFINQLKSKYSLNLEALSPKTLIYRNLGIANLKQTYVKSIEK